MILTGPEIVKRYRKGEITLDPFSPSSVNPNSYNYHLGDRLIVFSPGVISPGHQSESIEVTIPRGGYVLMPGRFYLGHTEEVIGSEGCAMSLIGRSTLGRLGLWLQVTADLGHTGSKLRWTLELKVVQPLRVYAGMPIGQVSFWEVCGEVERYRGKYQLDESVAPSRLSVKRT